VVFVPSCGFRIGLSFLDFANSEKNGFAEEIFADQIRGYGIAIA